jgi:hypothetical protein
MILGVAYLPSRRSVLFTSGMLRRAALYVPELDRLYGNGRLGRVVGSSQAQPLCNVFCDDGLGRDRGRRRGRPAATCCATSPYVPETKRSPRNANKLFH